MKMIIIFNFKLYHIIRSLSRAFREKIRDHFIVGRRQSSCISYTEPRGFSSIYLSSTSAAVQTNRMHGLTL